MVTYRAGDLQDRVHSVSPATYPLNGIPPAGRLGASITQTYERMLSLGHRGNRVTMEHKDMVHSTILCINARPSAPSVGLVPIITQPFSLVCHIVTKVLPAALRRGQGGVGGGA